MTRRIRPGHTTTVAAERASNLAAMAHHPAPPETTEKIAQPRRAEILDLAAGLFAEQGVDKTTMREIGRAAGMLSGSLYHYFDSKESIVTEIISGYLAARVTDCQRIAATHPDPRDRLAELLRSEIRDIAENFAARVVNNQSRYVLSLLPQHSEIRDLASIVRSTWIDTIEAGIEQGLFRQDIDLEIFYSLARKTSSVAQQWVNGLSDAPQPVTTTWGTDRLADAWISVLLDGFAVTRPENLPGARHIP